MGHPQHLTNNPGCHIIHSGSRIGCPIYQCKNHHIHATTAHQTRPPAATYTNANRQRNTTHATYQQNITQSPQSHGNVFPRATVLWCPRSILVLLETWPSELGRLLHKATPSHTPQDCTSYNTHSCQWSGIQETLPDNLQKCRIWCKDKEKTTTIHITPAKNVRRYKILVKTLFLTPTKLLKSHLVISCLIGNQKQEMRRQRY